MKEKRDHNWINFTFSSTLTDNFLHLITVHQVSNVIYDKNWIRQLL